jgi:spore maturation protein CgeB
MVHEWNAPRVVNHILSLKKKLHFRALFHDTHHRAYTNPRELLQIKFKDFDGVLAFGGALRRIYREAFGLERVWTFHEAADLEHFHPVDSKATEDVVWVGNWGDDERGRELEEFLLKPLHALRSRATVYGVRYPSTLQQCLKDAGIRYGGYLPNLAAKSVYGKSLVSLHIPRRFYSNGLSGVPTIRVFETLACGIPLVCSPWSDTECLFRRQEDYVVAPDGDAMRATLSWLIQDSSARTQIAAQGLETIRERHTCTHRAEQLLEIFGELER